MGEASTQKSRKQGLRSFFCRIQCDNESFDPGDVLSFSPSHPPFSFFFFFYSEVGQRCSSISRVSTVFIHLEGVNSSPYSAFIRHHHCCLICNGEGVFMNVHKHISCQVSVLCMLSKHPGPLIIFPSAGAMRCVSSRERIGFSVWFAGVACSYKCVLVCVKGRW